MRFSLGEARLLGVVGGWRDRRSSACADVRHLLVTMSYVDVCFLGVNINKDPGKDPICQLWWRQIGIDKRQLLDRTARGTPHAFDREWGAELFTRRECGLLTYVCVRIFFLGQCAILSLRLDREGLSCERYLLPRLPSL